MSASTIPPRTGLLQTGLKVAISAIVVGAFVAVLLFHKAVQDALTDLIAPPALPNKIQPPNALATPTGAVAVFWPRFPRNSAPNARRTTINGVEMLAEDWETTASAREVLSYYRSQMAARGWTDMTEETYGLRPEARAEGGNIEALQDPRFLELYHQVMDSTLVLQRGSWSMHVMTDSRGKTPGRIAVRIVAAATPSLRDFSVALSAALKGKLGEGQSRRAIDTVERRGDQRYRTVVDVKNQEPARAFESALAEMRAAGWRPISLSPTTPGQAGHFAWLARGSSYATLSITPVTQGRGATITRTEVTPER